MRMTSLPRASVGSPNWRLDPSFHFQQENIDSLVSADAPAHALLGDLVSELLDGTRLPSADSGIPVLRLTNLRACDIDFNDLGYVQSDSGESWPRARSGDVVFARSASPFRAAVVEPDCPSPLTVSPEIAILRPLPAVLPEYLAAVLSTSAFARVLNDLSYKGQRSALQRLRTADLKRLPIPLPARSVQQEIGIAYDQAVHLSMQAQKEMSSVVRSVHREIDTRAKFPDSPGHQVVVRRSSLQDRWDVSYVKSRQYRAELASALMLPILDLARYVPSSLRGIGEDEVVWGIHADDVNRWTFLVEGAETHKLADLSARMRQPLSAGDVLLCTTGSGQQIAYLDEALAALDIPILGSATFTALRFRETPRFYAVALSHPVVRRQLEQLSAGTIQRFVNKRELDELLVPSLGIVWREDFETRLQRAMQRRRGALAARTRLLAVAEEFVRKGLES
jgi:hypothetical protein